MRAGIRSSLRFALLIAWLWVTSMAGVAHAQVKISAKARELFKTGVRLLNDKEGPRYEEAYRAFRAAHQDSPSPKILGNLGLCAMKLERYGEAIANYEVYLRDVAKIDPTERKQIGGDLVTLKGSVAHVHLTITPANATVIDERVPNKGDHVINRYKAGSATTLVLGLRSGLHQLRIELAGYKTQRLELDLAPKQKEERTVVLVSEAVAPAPKPLPPPPLQPALPEPDPVPPTAAPEADEPQRPVPTSVFIALGVAGALGLAGGIVGGVALNTNSDYGAAKTAGDIGRAADLLDKGERLNLVADILFGTAGAAAVVSGILYFTRPAAEPNTLVIPSASQTGAALTIVSRF